MTYHHKPALGMDDIHHLLGVTLRDAEQQRQGRIVGLDYNHQQPIIDIIWQGQKKVERIAISLEQLAGLVEAFVASRRAASMHAVSGRTSTTSTSTPAASAESSSTTITEPPRRRA